MWLFLEKATSRLSDVYSFLFFLIPVLKSVLKLEDVLKIEDGEMAQGLRAHATLPEDPSFALSFHIR